MYQSNLKRILDFSVAFFGLLILSPIFVLVAIGLFIANDGKPFFYQMRPGKNEKLFKIIKFKTMNDKKDSEGNLLLDKDRLTKIGSFVRKTSLDEIPQLINVLKGDMSLIGPRPLLIKYLPYFTNEERLRHSVRPGITGWAQINGRNTVGWDERLAFDVFYVKNISFSLDVKIVLLTIKSVLFGKDIEVDPESKLLNLDEQRKI